MRLFEEQLHLMNKSLKLEIFRFPIFFFLIEIERMDTRILDTFN